eukprot:1157909-Pelagomonas_calceolata.AAC.3
MEGAVGGLGHAGSGFGWLSAQTCRLCMQQGSPIGTSSALRICSFNYLSDVKLTFGGCGLAGKQQDVSQGCSA